MTPTANEAAGNAESVMQISDSPDFHRFAEVNVTGGGKRTRRHRGRLSFGAGKKALYFRFHGTGALDFYSFLLEAAGP